MQTALGMCVVVIALVGLGEGTASPASQGTPARDVPMISYEIRYITVGSPEWRGQFVGRLQPVARQDGTAVWALDAQALRDLLTFVQGDVHANILQAPIVTARIGEGVSLANETATNYVANLRRNADGPPNQATRIAFEPEVDKVHEGIRIKIAPSKIKGPGTFGRVIIEENHLVAIHTATHKETLKDQASAEPSSGSPLVDRVRRNVGNGKQAISSQIQVPEVDSRRVEGEWLIPSHGALIVSLGPRTRRDAGFRKTVEERLVAVTARQVEGKTAALPARTVTSRRP